MTSECEVGLVERGLRVFGSIEDANYTEFVADCHEAVGVACSNTERNRKVIMSSIFRHKRVSAVRCG